MRRTVKHIALPLLLAATVPAGMAWAQTPAAGPQPPSAETMSRLQDGRIAGAKAALRLNDAQLKLWAPIEELLKKAAADREAMRAEWEKKRADATNAAPTPLPERLQKQSEFMTKRAADMKALADAIQPLYASFSDEQKAVAGPVFAQLFGHHGRGGHKGHHFGMHQRPPLPPTKG